MGGIWGRITATGRWIELQATNLGALVVAAVVGPLDEPEWITTDKDVEFVGAIIQNAKEDASLAIGAAVDKIIITDIMIEADQNLQFYLLFWSTDGFEDADLDLDSFLGFVDLDIPNNGFRIAGANQYYLNLTGVELHYEDDDATNELHVSLLNRSAVAKIAGGAGEVKIKIGYKVRE